jgi:hypothetical protein
MANPTKEEVLAMPLVDWVEDDCSFKIGNSDTQWHEGKRIVQTHSTDNKKFWILVYYMGLDGFTNLYGTKVKVKEAKTKRCLNCDGLVEEDGKCIKDSDRNKVKDK